MAEQSPDWLLEWLTDFGMTHLVIPRGADSRYFQLVPGVIHYTVLKAAGFRPAFFCRIDFVQTAR